MYSTARKWKIVKKKSKDMEKRNNLSLKKKNYETEFEDNSDVSNSDAEHERVEEILFR